MAGTHDPPPSRRPRWLRVVLLGVVGGLLVTGLGYEILLFWMMTGAAQSQVCCETPKDWGFPDYLEVELAGHGETLTGWFIPGDNGAAVILLHPGGIHRMGTANEAKVLARAGFSVLLYDRRAHGDSTGEINSYGWLDWQDVPAAVAFLARQDGVDPERIGIFGASLGGQVALRAAASWPESLRAVWVDGPSLCGVADIPPRPGEPWKRFGRKLEAHLYTLLMTARTGMAAPPAVVEVIADVAPNPLVLVATEEIEQRVVRHYYQHAGEPKELWVVPEATHGGAWSARPEEYPRRLVAFFSDALGVSPRPIEQPASTETPPTTTTDGDDHGIESPPHDPS